MATYQQQLDPLNKKRAELDAQRQKLNSQLTSLNAGRDKLLASEPGQMIGAGKDAVYAPGSATLTAEARIAETQRQLAAQAPQYKGLTNQYNAITKSANTDANLQRAGLAPTQPAVPRPSWPGVTGGSSAAVGAGAQAPTAPAKPDRPSAPAAPAAGSPEEVIGTFNGRAITRAESDRLSGKLPTASGPVVMGPNGSYAAATGGGAQPAGAASALPIPTYGGQGQGAVIGDPSKGTEAERTKLMSNLSSLINELQMSGANMRGANMRSKRDLLSTLIGMQTRMNEAKAGNEVTLAGQQNAANIAALNEQGAWNRSVLGEQGANRRADMTDATNRYLGNLNDYGASFRALMGLQPKAEYVTDTNGNTVRVDGTQYTAVTGADGSPLRTQQKDSGLTAKDLLADITAREKNLSDLRAMGDTPELQAQAQQLAQERAALMKGGQARSAATAVKSKSELDALPSGARYVGPDGVERIKP